MNYLFYTPILLAVIFSSRASNTHTHTPFADTFPKPKYINRPDDGFRGIWYSNEPVPTEYVFKYAGGLATYPSNHYPFSVYSPEVNKTFFCYGGTDAANSTLFHEVSYFDHKTGMVARPYILLDKETDDAHDNPVIQVDKQGYIWIFSTSHGRERPSFIHKSAYPYQVDSFKRVEPYKLENGKRVPMTNFSYLQMYYDKTFGFLGLFTSYELRQLRYGKKNCRNIAYMTSKDGIEWSEWKFLAKIEEGHYQTSGRWKNRIGTSFNYHPNKETGNGLNYRTNLYYLFTDDYGKTWKTADGKKPILPLAEISNEALIHDYVAEGLNVYINDLNYDANGNPVILYETGKGYEPGLANGRKEWHTAWFNGKSWEINDITSSDNNYDMGSLYIEANGTWKIIAPTEDGPQAYNTGGEIALWISADKGRHWTKEKQLTVKSERNQSYPRRPVNANPGFYAFWADGDGRKKSKSNLYFSDEKGTVYRLPEKMTTNLARPERVSRN